MSDRIDREVTVFDAARAMSPEARAAYLDDACAGDPALRQRVEELLRLEDQAGDFLQEPAPGAQRRAQPSAPFSPRPGALAGERAGNRIGRYKLLQQIGEGGCGVVYMAEQEEPVRRRVALKVIKLGMDTKQVIARFEAERQALALMDHPKIARVFDAGATGAGRPYFVMELVHGVKITSFCDENNLPTEERLRLFIQVCHAIQHAHQKGIIHRDIKPSNILVTQLDGEYIPKIIDFGIAKATGGQVLTDKTLFTAFERFVGTPAYMSPEQAELTAPDVDTRSDIYALGVLLYELLTGKTPFDQRDLVACGLEEMRRIIREKEPVRPSTRLSTLAEAEQTTVARQRHAQAPQLIHLVRGDLDWVVMKCLEKERSRRYPTANALACDLERHLNQEPVLARPPSRGYRVQKWVHRNKLFFVAATSVTLALILGLGGVSAMYLRERILRRQLIASERDQAVERADVALASADFDAMHRALIEADQHGISDARLLMLKGIYSCCTGAYRDAIEPLQRAVQLMPRCVAARALLANAYLAKNWAGLEKQVAQLHSLQPVTWEDYLFEGQAIGWDDPQRQLYLMDKAVELKRNSALARLIRSKARADLAVSSHDLDLMQSALDDLEAARPFVPRENDWVTSRFAIAHAQAARLCGEAGRTSEQEQHLHQAEQWGRRLDDLPQGSGARIVQLELSGREAEAFAYMQRVLPRHDPVILSHYAEALYRRGRVQEADDVYANVSQDRAADEYGEYMRLLARMELSGAGAQIKPELDRFFANFTGGVPELFAPDTYRLAGLMDEAERRAQANYNHLPERVSFFSEHYLRMAQFQAGRLGEAALVEAGRGSGRELVEVYTAIGISHLASGDRAGARENFRKALQTGMYWYVYYHLAANLLPRLDHDPNWPPWIPLKSPAAAADQAKASKE